MIGSCLCPVLGRPRAIVVGLLVLNSLGGGASALSMMAAGAPSAAALKERVLSTAAGATLAAEFEARARGAGTPHRSSKLRLFGTEAEPRVTLYRDTAAWCPYCQKLWIMLEEKEVPYRVELINMRSYGDKPASFTSKVRGGLLPALELDGTMYTESLAIMAMVDAVFTPDQGHRALLPGTDDPKEMDRCQRLLKEERQMFGAWCDAVFRGGRLGPLERCMDRLNAALLEQDGPWLSAFSTEGPSIVDLQYVSHVERILASVAYWKGENFRNSRWPAIDRWFEAFEARPSYTATRSDFYTHVMDIPPQYGKGVPTRSEAQRRFADSIDGADKAALPLPHMAESTRPADMAQPGWGPWEADAPVEAAYHLVTNMANVAKFAARAVGKPGGWATGRPDRAALSDPNAKPAEGQSQQDAEAALRLVAQALLDGGFADATATTTLDAFVADLATAQRRTDTALCCAYLRDRVGVPRDMSYPAARILRATLNTLIEALDK